MDLFSSTVTNCLRLSCIPRANLYTMSCEPSRTRAYSSDLRWRMIYQRKVLNMSTTRISKCLLIDPPTVRRTVNLFAVTGSAEKKSPYLRPFTKTDQSRSATYPRGCSGKPGIYFHELKLELQARGTFVDESIVCRFLKASNFSRKQMRKVAVQQPEELRARYVAEISLYRPNTLVFLDETGSDRKTAMRKFGHSLRGTRCCCTRLLAKGGAIAALSTEGIMDVQFVGGSVNGNTFANFTTI